MVRSLPCPVVHVRFLPCPLWVQLGPVWGSGLGVGVAVNRTKSLSVGMCALWEVSLLSLVSAAPSLALGMFLSGEIISVWVSPLSGWVGFYLCRVSQLRRCYMDSIIESICCSVFGGFEVSPCHTIKTYYMAVFSFSGRWYFVQLLNGALCSLSYLLRLDYLVCLACLSLEETCFFPFISVIG